MNLKLLTLIICLAFTTGYSQSYEHKWNVGLHGGAMQYWGDLGSSFYRFDRAFYGNAGISVSRYLNRRWDAFLFVTRGVVGFMGPWNADPSVTTNFLTNLTTVNLLARYNFSHPESWVRPYVCGGLGVVKHNLVGDSYFERSNKIDFAAPELGAGLNFRFGKYLGLQVQELLMYNSADDIDRTEGGINDVYLLHTIGITCNLGKLGKLGGPEKTGVGADIDKCSKFKQHRSSKLTKSEGNKRRDAKKAQRKAKKKNKVGFFARLFHRKK